MLSLERVAASLSEMSRSSSNGLLVRSDWNQSQYTDPLTRKQSQSVRVRTLCERCEHGVGGPPVTMLAW